jgi:hypothetical protein
MRVLEEYCQDDVTGLRQTCQVFRRQILHVGYVDVFLESVTIASACNKFPRIVFLETDIKGLIPAGGYKAMSITARKPSSGSSIE